ncbi:MAG: D-alanine--D-alanine ligase [Chlorobiaceae bacterium]|nr:D-alanine--D-alanine ligase [Chlorobiaceae bacterium]
MTENEGEPPSSQGKFFPKSNPSPKNNPNSENLHPSDLYAEWDTFETIDAVRSALAEHHSVTMIEADEHAFSKLQKLVPQIVFNIAEGLNGVSREAQIPAMLEMLGLPYSGSDPLTLAICLDKSRAKEILSYYNIPTAKFAVIHSKADLNKCKIFFPNIVKPLHEGSSKGIYNSSIVHTAHELEKVVTATLDKYQQPVLVEEYLPGREFTVAILGNGNDLQVLPIVEIKFDTLPTGVNPIYSFEAKWIWDQSDAPLEIFTCPADLSQELEKEIVATSKQAYKILRCRDWCRIDVRLDSKGTPNIIELNPLPGILPKPEDNSCFPKAARAAGLSYNQLIQSVLLLAAQRYGLMEPSFQSPN